MKLVDLEFRRVGHTGIAGVSGPPREVFDINGADVMTLTDLGYGRVRLEIFAERKSSPRFRAARNRRVTGRK